MRVVSTLFKERFAVDFKMLFIDFFRISKVNEFASNLEIVEKDSKIWGKVLNNMFKKKGYIYPQTNTTN